MLQECGWNKNKETEFQSAIEAHRRQYRNQIRREIRDLETLRYRQQLHECEIPQLRLLSFLTKLRHFENKEGVSRRLPPLLTFIELSIQYCPDVKLQRDNFTVILELMMQERNQVSQILFSLLQFWINKLPLCVETLKDSIELMMNLANTDKQKQFKILHLIRIMLAKSKQLCFYYYQRQLQFRTVKSLLDSKSSESILELLGILRVVQSNCESNKRKECFLGALPVLIKHLSHPSDEIKVAVTTIITQGVRAKHIMVSELITFQKLIQKLVDNLNTTHQTLKLESITLIGILVSLTESSFCFVQLNLLDHLYHSLDTGPQILKNIVWIISNLMKQKRNVVYKILDHPLFGKLIDNKMKACENRQVSEMLQYQIYRIVFNVIQTYEKESVWEFIVKHHVIAKLFSDFDRMESQIAQYYIRLLHYLLELATETDATMRHYLASEFKSTRIYDSVVAIIEQENRPNAYAQNSLLMLQSLFQETNNWPL